MSGERITRRLALGLPLACTLASAPAVARGRLPMGGKLAFRVPFALTAIDPHRLDDPLAAIFADALFDSLYVRDAGGLATSLAEAEPELTGDGVSVRIRRGLVTAENRPIDARDVVHSIARSRRNGGRGWLGDLPVPERTSDTSIRFATRDAPRVMQLLASPITAIVPIAFEPEHPDGTGAFHAVRRSDALALVRNGRAARGPALLDEVLVRSGSDLAASLRAFESGTDDVGWLGSGINTPRAGAKTFDAGAAAWIVLRAGRDAGAWDAPGALQRLLDGVAPGKLGHLGLGPPWNKEKDEGWGGPAGDVLVREDAPYLVEVARTIAGLLSRTGHELTLKPVPARELATRRAKKDHLLAVDVVRPLAPGAVAAWIALVSSDEAASTADLAKKPPKLAEVPARALARTLRVGVVGELHVQGARVPDVVLPAGEAGWDLALATRARRAP